MNADQILGYITGAGGAVVIAYLWIRDLKAALLEKTVHINEMRIKLTDLAENGIEAITLNNEYLKTQSADRARFLEILEETKKQGSES